MAIGQRKDRFGAQGNAHLVELGHHFMNALLADVLKLFDFRQQSGLPHVQEITEQMHFMAVKFRRQLRARIEYRALHHEPRLG